MIFYERNLCCLTVIKVKIASHFLLVLFHVLSSWYFTLSSRSITLNLMMAEDIHDCQLETAILDIAFFQFLR